MEDLSHVQGSDKNSLSEMYKGEIVSEDMNIEYMDFQNDENYVRFRDYFSKFNKKDQIGQESKVMTAQNTPKNLDNQ